MNQRKAILNLVFKNYTLMMRLKTKLELEKQFVYTNKDYKKAESIFCRSCNMYQKKYSTLEHILKYTNENFKKGIL
jgi:hypothetical protein